MRSKLVQMNAILMSEGNISPPSSTTMASIHFSLLHIIEDVYVLELVNFVEHMSISSPQLSGSEFPPVNGFWILMKHILTSTVTGVISMDFSSLKEVGDTMHLNSATSLGPISLWLSHRSESKFPGGEFSHEVGNITPSYLHDHDTHGLQFLRHHWRYIELDRHEFTWQDIPLIFSLFHVKFPYMGTLTFRGNSSPVAPSSPQPPEHPCTSVFGLSFHIYLPLFRQLTWSD